jgi:hypothetical protein
MALRCEACRRVIPPGTGQVAFQVTLVLPATADVRSALGAIRAGRWGPDATLRLMDRAAHSPDLDPAAESQSGAWILCADCVASVRAWRPHPMRRRAGAGGDAR